MKSTTYVYCLNGVFPMSQKMPLNHHYYYSLSSGEIIHMIMSYMLPKF